MANIEYDMRTHDNDSLKWNAEHGILYLVLRLLDLNADIQIEQRETWKRK